MTVRRFMIKSRSIRDGYASFDGELFNHIVRVLRLTTGTPLLLVDEHATEHEAVIDQIDRDWLVVKIVVSGRKSMDRFLSPKITICQALPKGDKLDLVLQKGTELGVHDFRIFAGKRSVAKISEDKQEAKLERWKRIATEASRQSQRLNVPQVSWFESLETLCAKIDHNLRILLWVDEKEHRLKPLIAGHPKPESACIVVGPEGGLDKDEAELLMGNGFLAVTLGSRILRTETAALATVSILQYIWDDI